LGQTLLSAQSLQLGCPRRRAQPAHRDRGPGASDQVTSDHRATGFGRYVLLDWTGVYRALRHDAEVSGGRYQGRD
jgi:hypothetical protein